MSFLKSISEPTSQSGSALVISVIVLAILAALGISALDVAGINLFISANDRDTKKTFFHADSGANIGHEYIEAEHFSSDNSTNSTFYESNANDWMNATNSTSLSPETPVWGDGLSCTEPQFLSYYVGENMGTYVRAGVLRTGLLEGSAAQIGAGYEGIGKSASHGGTYTNYLIRSRRYGQRNSFAEVDLGWRHVNR